MMRPAPRRLERAYQSAVTRLLDAAFKRVAAPGMTPRQMADAVRGVIHDATYSAATNMVRWADASNARGWREAAARSQNGRLVAEALRREASTTPVGARILSIIRENAALISSIPLHAAEQATYEAERAAAGGSRPDAVAKLLRARFPKLLRSKIALVSRTETQKASTALNRARSEDLDLEWYVWLSSRDARTRRSHKKMDGVLVPWSQPPDPEALVGEKSTLGHYHSGEAPNCRCTQSVLLHVDDVPWPRRVYWGGRIQRLTRAQFLALPPNIR
jgi:SPP1 gp7 family putative phage head morphogenesis protein